MKTIVLLLCWTHVSVLGVALQGMLLDKVLDVYIPDSDVYDNELCKNHSSVYRQSLKHGSIWALRMLDASSKIPSGIMTGNLVELGNYDECVAVDTGEFSGQQCLVEVSLPRQGGQEVVDLLEGEVVVSVCVPSTCRAQDVQAHLRSVLPMLSLTVHEVTCSTRPKQISFTPLDLFAIALLLLLASLVVCSTTYDLCCTDPELDTLFVARRRHQLLVAFSLYTNGRKLLSTDDVQDSLSALHGVRFLSMVWVVLGHRYLFTVFLPATNIVDKLDILYDYRHLFIINASVSVDSFLLLSGLLVTYTQLKELDMRRSFNVPVLYLHRYIRLTPAFALMILLTVTLFPYTSDGPLWKLTSELDTKVCVTSWWSSLLYVNNYVHPDDMCLMQSWYLSVDMQLFWVAPLIVYPLWRYPMIGKLLLGVTLVIGLVIAYLVPYVNQFSAGVIVQTVDINAKEYVTTHTRYTPWLLGVALGYLLHTTKAHQLRLCPVWVIIGWLLAGGIMLTSVLFKHRFMQAGHEYERVLESLYQCLMRPAWALGLAWIIYACVKGYGGCINTLLSWRVFHVLGRFTYTTYLVHVRVITWTSKSARTPTYISDVDVIRQMFGDLALSLAAAIVLTLVLEVPIINIERALCRSPQCKNPAAFDKELATEVEQL